MRPGGFQSARSKMPGSRSSHSPSVSSMSSSLGANTSNTSRPPGSSIAAAAPNARLRSSSPAMWSIDRKGMVTSGTRSVTGGSEVAEAQVDEPCDPFALGVLACDGEHAR